MKMNDKHRCIAALACLLVVGCVTKPDEAEVRGLPISQHAYRIIDRSISEITVGIVGPGSYSVLGTGTNADGLAHVFARATAESSERIPVAIRAKPETPFSNVWAVVTLASAKGCGSRFDVRVPDVEWPKYLKFYDAETLSGSPTNVIHVVCRKGGVQIQDRPVTTAQLRNVFERLANLGPNLVISIVAAGDVPFQGVIDVLDACEGVGLEHRLLQMDRN